MGNNEVETNKIVESDISTDDTNSTNDEGIISSNDIKDNISDDIDKPKHNKKTLIIGGSVIGFLLILGTVYYFMNNMSTPEVSPIVKTPIKKDIVKDTTKTDVTKTDTAKTDIAKTDVTKTDTTPSNKEEEQLKGLLGKLDGTTKPANTDTDTSTKTVKGTMNDTETPVYNEKTSVINSAESSTINTSVKDNTAVDTSGNTNTINKDITAKHKIIIKEGIIVMDTNYLDVLSGGVESLNSEGLNYYNIEPKSVIEYIINDGLKSKKNNFVGKIIKSGIYSITIDKNYNITTFKKNGKDMQNSPVIGMSIFDIDDLYKPDEK